MTFLGNIDRNKVLTKDKKGKKVPTLAKSKFPNASTFKYTFEGQDFYGQKKLREHLAALWGSCGNSKIERLIRDKQVQAPWQLVTLSSTGCLVT